MDFVELVYTYPQFYCLIATGFFMQSMSVAILNELEWFPAAISSLIIALTWPVYFVALIAGKMKD